MSKNKLTVTREQCGSMQMVNGGEKTHPRIIAGGTVMNWVGFGWVDEGEATDEDKTKYPTVEDW